VIKLVINPTTLSADTTSDYTSLTAFNETDNVFAYDDTTDTWSGGRIIEETIVPKNGGVILDLREDDVYLAAGDVLVISALSTAANTVDVSVTAISDN
jgi:hypothetical protein